MHLLPPVTECKFSFVMLEIGVHGFVRFDLSLYLLSFEDGRAKATEKCLFFIFIEKIQKD